MSETATGSDSWERYPPYRLAAQSADGKDESPAKSGGGQHEFDKKLQASCHCGRVRYWISREKPLVAKYCHCRGCQKLHGAPFQWAAIFHKSDILFEHGSQGIEFYNSGSKHAGHELPCKLSCSNCRAPIMDEGRRMVLLFPTLIDFAWDPLRAGGGENVGEPLVDDEKVSKLKDGFYPDCHIFYNQRVVDIPDGKPKWQGLDGVDGILCDNVP